MGVSNEKREELIEVLIDMPAPSSDLSIRELSELIVDQIIKEGWQWHPKALTDFDLEFNKVSVKQEPLADWEKELLYSPYDEDAEWKIITQLPVDTYVINRAGIVMNKITGETVAPIFSNLYQKWVIVLEIEGKKHYLLPDRVAEELFELVERLVVDPPVDLKKVSERIEETQGEKIEFVEPTWVRIPKFEDYEVNSLGVVRNFWTKRVLGVRGVLPAVELHDHEGYPRNMTVKHILNNAFPKED